MTVRMTLLALALAVTASSPAAGQTERLEIKWMRDSAEYQHLVRQIYHAALERVRAARAGVPDRTVWAVVIDVDETVLDNSAYQLERAAYDLPYDTASWNAFVRLEASPAVPGVTAFLAAVRELGGRIAFVTNRHEWTRDATRRNLTRLRLWQEGDLLCLRTLDSLYTKRARRSQVRSGSGACAWAGSPARIVAYVGDQMGDMPDPDEVERRVFGENLFLLPNPTYGDWEDAVTREW